jgi:undecaprenyl diphosphate synthase
MRLLVRFLRIELRELKRRSIRLRTIGRLEKLPAAARACLNRAVSETSRNTGLVLTLALNYSARQEIFDAARRMARDSRRKASNRDDFRRYLYDPVMPDPDLVIRTSGEMRLSDFLLWQAAYAELWFTPVLWPEFRRRHLLEAFRVFQRRQRRFGGVG